MDTDEECMMHSKSDNKKIMEELFQFVLSRYRIGLETSMKGSAFVFDCVHLLCYKCHEINLNWDESYINSHNWVKNRKSTINSINKKENKCFQCFQYAVTVTLNHEKIGVHYQKIKTKPFIDRYNWEGINFP